MGFLEFLLGLILFFYLLGWIGRLLLRLWVCRMQRKFEQNPQEGNFRTYTWNFGGHNRRPNTPKQEGDITIKTNTSSSKQVREDIGDYVDFEEIEKPNKE